MTKVATTVTGFLLGLFGSWLFWRYLLHLKPTVRISAYVLKGPHLLNEQETLYRIKIHNFGRRQVIDLVADASIWEFRTDRLVFVRRLQLSMEGAVPVLGANKYTKDPWKAVSPGFTFLILGEGSLEQELGDTARLRMTLSCKDAISGTAVVQRVVYSNSDIQEGDFEGGASMKRKKA